MRVLVTGASGFLGKRLKKHKPEWFYVSTKDYNLLSMGNCNRMIYETKPDAVIHLAAKVGGIKANTEQQADFLYLNMTINSNVIEAAKQCGIKRLLASLSTCAFPDILDNYPFVEEDLHKGPPAASNLSYGFSKRLLQVQCLSYRNQYGLNYSTFCPSNLYGPEDHFNQESSHFVASLITKLSKAKSGDTIEIWGTGKPLRQQLYVDDLCKIIVLLLEKHHTEQPIIVAPDENLSIEEMCNIGAKCVRKEINFVYNGKYDGQFRKDGSNKLLKQLIGDFKFTKFEDGFKKTYKEYINETI